MSHMEHDVAGTLIMVGTGNLSTEQSRDML